MKECKKLSNRRYQRSRKGREAEYKRRRQLRLDVLKAYSNEELVCVNCGFTDVRALCLDHINADGRENGHSKNTESLFRKLRREGYPEGYQTLCANCNQIKAVEKGEFSGKGEKDGN